MPEQHHSQFGSGICDRPGFFNVFSHRPEGISYKSQFFPLAFLNF